MTPHSSRIAGLDTLRALAIVLVLLFHYRVFVANTPSLGWPGQVGWMGVDLFFVLSGYLIAQQVLKGDSSRLSLRGFWARRALRTWPLFWLVLAVYFCWPGGLGGKEPFPLWRFLTFTQNIGLQPGTTFSHAWSLCVEEQFYLLLPLGVVLLSRLRLGLRGAWALLAGLSLLAVVARGWAWWHFGREPGGSILGYYSWLYYATWCRFDEFLPGIAVALVQHRHPQLWRALQQRPWGLSLLALLAAVGAVWLALAGDYQEGVGMGVWLSVPGYALIAWAFALAVVAALTPGSALARWQVPGAAALARWSYAIYLSHRIVGELLKRAGDGQWSPMALFLLAMAGSVLVGWVLHRLVERPVLRWRDRHAPPLFRSRAPQQAHSSGQGQPEAR